MPLDAIVLDILHPFKGMFSTFNKEISNLIPNLLCNAFACCSSGSLPKLTNNSCNQPLKVITAYTLFLK